MEDNILPEFRDMMTLARKIKNRKANGKPGGIFSFSGTKKELNKKLC